MTVPAEAKKSKIVQRLARAFARRVASRQRTGALGFVRQLFAHASPDDLAAGEAGFVAASRALWSLLQTRRPGAAKVRVFNPDGERDGWSSPHTVIQIVNDDMPFIIDSVTAHLNQIGLAVHVLLHPVVKVRRQRTGRLVAVDPDGSYEDGVRSESVVHIEVTQLLDPPRRKTLEDDIRAILADVRVAVEDWREMRVRVAGVVAGIDSSPPSLPARELDEAKAFLRWADDNNFTFIGYREYALAGKGKTLALTVVPKSGLGILRDDKLPVIEGVKDGKALPPGVADFIRTPTLVQVSKANRRSTVHRAAPLDMITVKRFDRSGRVIGERLFVGLFTSLAYSHWVRDIPLLRHKVDTVLKRAGFKASSHDGKALLHILETLPRDELFQISEDELFDMTIGILQLQERYRIALFARRDPYGRFVSCLVYVPRDRYSTALRLKMQDILAAGFGGEAIDFTVQISESALARLHVIVRIHPGDAPRTPVDQIEAQLAAAGRDWTDDLLRALTERHGEARAYELFRAYGDAFPLGYRERYSAAEAADDVERVERALVQGSALTLEQRPQAGPDALRFKIYNRDAPVPLSDVLPMLENMGLKVLDEVPFRIAPRERNAAVWLHCLGLQSRHGAPTVDFARLQALFEEGFARIWAAELENDGFNRLILGAGLGWRQIVVLRAYCKYLRQTGIPFSQAYMEDTLGKHPAIAAALVELFETLFDPAGARDADKRAARVNKRILDALEKVAILDEDRILRRYLNAIESTLRTNFFQRAADGGPKPYFSFKLDSRRVEDLPLPRPMFEIFVHSPRMEGIHLRGGKVARGGIRWSDRREDFRTEILGLMKAQMTKNAVIVPVGAKGGFVVKRPPAGGRDAMQREGVECYKTLIRGMLDITDNLLPGSKTAPPPDVVRRDDDDPYLVVAADKGTATFSDIANALAREYGFWLDDAFASGGSAGYDHKTMGITARGAWESVKRHFRGLGLDTQSQDFTCIGIGDMSGDVFGNGMLQSRHIRLLAAFNHLHIFIDPNPDARKSFAERKRLFKLARSSWNDYDPKLISTGGGAFDRAAKSIKVSREMRGFLDLGGKDAVTPNELIRAILKAQADLFYLGGIGTYVKASSESHAEVGDRANDAIRVDGRELRGKVVAEGANLGVTQRGRIEYALAGGRINTDFIDNSAGVDTSDHEVNIKILLGEVIAAGKLAMAARNKLLFSMTDEVAQLVLLDNYRQTMALDNAEAQGMAMLDEGARFMRALEKVGKLNRAVEFLPDDETLEERRAAKISLARPELAVLLAYAKITLNEELLHADVPDDRYLLQDVGLYFPKPLRTRYADFIPRHRLRREITATYVTNSLVNRTSPCFVNEMHELSGRSAPDIVRAYLACRQSFALRSVWAEIEALDAKVPAQLQTDMQLAIQALIRHVTLWFLKNAPHPLDVTATIEKFGPAVATLMSHVEKLLSPDLAARAEADAARFIERGAPPALARRIAYLRMLAPACDIVHLAERTKRPLDATAQLYYAVGARFGFDWLRDRTQALVADNGWQRLAIATVVDDLYAQQTDVTRQVARAVPPKAPPAAAIETWFAKNGHAGNMGRIESLLSELKAANAVDISMLLVANREIRGLLGH